MTTIGYARVSSLDQNLDIQEAALKAADADVIRSEKRSGTTTTGRAELETVLEFLRPGDTLTAHHPTLKSSTRFALRWRRYPARCCYPGVRPMLGATSSMTTSDDTTARTARFWFGKPRPGS
jgi:hypothetical protein